MTILSLPDDTEPGIRPIKSPYEFRITPDEKYIWINNGKIWKPYSIEVLRFMEKNSGLPEPVRDMAYQALAFFGKEDKGPEDYTSDTITELLGVKVYQYINKRSFFARIRGKLISRKHLSDLERAIKSEVE
jgi:hypothetical protein